MNVMKYYYAIRNDEQEDFREAWKDLYELMLNERSRARRTLYTAMTTMCKEIFWYIEYFIEMHGLKKFPMDS